MAATPKFKVFDANGVYQAATKHPEDAAVLVACFGDGATIRVGHSRRHIVWEEGAEGQPASESYDHVAEVVYTRLSRRPCA